MTADNVVVVPLMRMMIQLKTIIENCVSLAGNKDIIPNKYTQSNVVLIDY